MAGSNFAAIAAGGVLVLLGVGAGALVANAGDDAPATVTIPQTLTVTGVETAVSTETVVDTLTVAVTLTEPLTTTFPEPLEPATT